MGKNISSSLREARLHRSNYYQVIDATPASIYLKDTNGVYIDCNKYMVEIAGLESREQIIGKTDYNMPWKSQAECFRKTDLQVINNNKTYQIEEEPETTDGKIRTFLSSKTPLLNSDGKIIGIIGVSIDITDKKIIEQQLQKSLSIKERFLKNISHETRNPMQAFVASAEVLADSWEKFSNKQRYDTIILIAKSARRLSNLINNTFDLSNLIKDDIELKFEKGNITELIKNSVKLFNEEASLNNKPFINIKSLAEYHLVYDKQQIQQVINNLLENAVKWSAPNEAITVELNKGFVPSSSIPCTYCCITNKGIQIPPDELDFIFEPYTESRNTASKACGVGLGLALCKEIIRVHKGKIWATNNTTEGVTFNFFIPDNLEGTANQQEQAEERTKSSSLQLTPVNYQSSLVMQKGQFALIGISPFNSYFSVKNIAATLSTVANHFDDFALFLPDKISRYTLEALNYKGNIHQKIRKQDNYLKNRALKALEELGISAENKIITLSSLLNNKEYIRSYNLVMDRFNNDERFRNGCLNTSSEILSNHSKYNQDEEQQPSNNQSDKDVLNTKSLMIGVQYFLKELPVFLHAPEILNVGSCCFVYPAIPKFLEEIYREHNLASKGQGFLT